MFFWFFMLVMVFIIPVTMAYFGKSFLEHPPEKINRAFGYRTARSMQNAETWDFAHRYCGKLWQTWGLLLMPVAFGVMLFFGSEDETTLGIVGGLLTLAEVAVVMSTLLSTERALQKCFDDNGARR